jgi:hypothetical protein
LTPSSRPSRLSALIHALVVGGLGLSFVSGVSVWYGQNVADNAVVPPSWLHVSRVVHGSLYPILCGVFGYLCCQHIRYGWALGANRVSGFTMEGVFLVLIFSALPIYYAREGSFRSICVTVHRLMGAGVPVVLMVHWIAAQRWVRKVSLPEASVLPSTPRK